MTGLTYSSFITAVTTLIPVSATDVNFVAITPFAIDYTEERISRELDLLSSGVRDTGALTTGSRNFALPTTQGTFVVVNSISAVTPAGTTAPNDGTRTPLVRVTSDFLDLSWPSVTGATLPRYYAMLSQSLAIVGPWPDAAYTLEVYGTQRFLPMSDTNTSNFLSTNLPDLYLAAAMVFYAGYMKNFGAQADDPKMAQSWETQYGLLKASAETEEFRKRAMGSAWTPMTQSPQAQPPRN